MMKTLGKHSKKIGLLGGMSWESTAVYYKLINEGIRKALGAHHSARLLLESLDFQPIMHFQHEDDWMSAGKILIEAAQRLERGGAECLLLCTNTMHKLAPEIASEIKIPLLHVADATANRISTAGHNCVGFLGTRFSMENEFYIGRLKNNFGLQVIVPNKADREIVHSIIYDELCMGIIKEDSRREYLRIINELEELGAQAVTEGCTEIALLINQSHTTVPLFDTTAIHAQAAVDFSIADCIF